MRWTKAGPCKICGGEHWTFGHDAITRTEQIRKDPVARLKDDRKAKAGGLMLFGLVLLIAALVSAVFGGLTDERVILTALLAIVGLILMGVGESMVRGGAAMKGRPR